MRRRIALLAAVLAYLCLAAPPHAAAQPSVLRFDFQPEGAPLARGYTAVTPADAYDPATGYGFTMPPRAGVDGSGHAWAIFGRRVTVDDAIPASVLSDATRDGVLHARPFAFRADVPPGRYDVTVWLGDVTRPTFQVAVAANGVTAEVERMDVLNSRGRLDMTTLPDGRTPGIGMAAPVVLADVDAGNGAIEVQVGPDADPAAVSWDYELDECPTVQPPERRTDVILPAYGAAGLQAITLHPHAEPALAKDDENRLVRLAAPADPRLDAALQAYNTGDIGAARTAFNTLQDQALLGAAGSGLFHVAGHPSTIEDEPAILAEARTALQAALQADPSDWAASDLLLQVEMALDAERYRRAYAYGGIPATENMGRSNALVERFGAGHPYETKGRILWLRNRGGLDPRRCTVSWERAQWLAGELRTELGPGANPYVDLYATDAWANDGAPWSRIEWEDLAGAGPEWARTLMVTLNSWLDLFEWWSIHRQLPTGEIGGGWTDDVEIVPAFGMTAYVLDGASDISEEATIRFVDGIWNSDIVDREAGYQAQYADVEHTAEPTGNSLHMYPMLRYGDPEGMERIMRSGRTFVTRFLTETTTGHTHVAGNHMSATEIARNPNHRGDIALNGRISQPFPFLTWYADSPTLEGALQRLAQAWVADASRTDGGKPEGVFPNFVWVPTDDPTYPDGTTPWYAASDTHGQFGAFPAYQYYLYNLAALAYLQTGDEALLGPFDALQRCALEWASAGRPTGPEPQPGQECAWAGGKLANVASSTLFELARATGRDDWDAFLDRFATSYARFYRAPSQQTLLEDGMDEIAQDLAKTWPYRTTEGLMTDRILIPGWYSVIAYYLGANVPSFFYGLPVQAATWSGTGRLFAAAVTEATTTELAVTAYRFADDERTVTIRPWGLQGGARYVLEAGPATDVGQPPTTIEQTIPFALDRRDAGVSFRLPGRTVTAIRIRQTEPGTQDPTSLPDPAIAPRDIALDARQGRLTVRVHNIGGSDATDLSVSVHEGRGPNGPTIGQTVVPSIEAPLDLVPRTVDLEFPYTPAELTREVTVVLDGADAIAEITEVNNVATAILGGTADATRPPAILAIEPHEIPAGTAAITVRGRHFQSGITALLAESADPRLNATFLDAETLTLAVAPDVPPGDHLVSVRNPDGQQSNLVVLRVTAPTPDPRPTIYLPYAGRR